MSTTEEMIDNSFNNIIDQCITLVKLANSVSEAVVMLERLRDR